MTSFPGCRRPDDQTGAAGGRQSTGVTGPDALYLRTVAVPTEQFGRKSDALNAALTSDSPRAQLSRDVLNTLAGEDADSIGD